MIVHLQIRDLITSVCYSFYIGNDQWRAQGVEEVRGYMLYPDCLIFCLPTENNLLVVIESYSYDRVNNLY